MGRFGVSVSQLSNCGVGCAVVCFNSSAQLVNYLPAMQETPVQFLGQEDLLEKGQATHSSIVELFLWLSQ